jgi:DNA polymerase-4
MDAFFASVEQVRDPSLRGKPLIIGGNRKDRRGVVSTASYEARTFGVHSAMPLSTAKRLCPNGVFMRGNREFYSQASRKVRSVLDTISPLVEMASIDEAYVDVTGSQAIFHGDDSIAAYVKSEIHRLTELSCTIAIAPNKLVAKVGSDFAKPDGYVRIDDGREEAFLAPLPVGKLPGFGPRTCEALGGLGIVTLGELARFDLRTLARVFGDQAQEMQRRARGESDSPVVTDREAKSIGRETTFEYDLDNWSEIERVLAGLAERALVALRTEGLEARTVTLKVRYAGFDTRTFATTLRTPTCVDSEVFAALRRLLPQARAEGRPVRLIGMSLSQLGDGARQLDLFGEGVESGKWQKALRSVDSLRVRHGFESVRSGMSLHRREDHKHD